MTRAEENLDYWTRLHMLPRGFPLLERKTRISDPFLRDDSEELKSIIEHIQGAFRSMIIFPPGQGISTLLSEVLRRLRSSDVRIPQLFVLIDTSQFSGEQDLAGALYRGVALEIIRQLTSDGWGRALHGTARQQLFAVLGFSDDRPLLDLEYGVKSGQPRSADEMAHIAKGWENRLAQLYRTLYEKVGISVTLCFDFAHTATDDLILEVFREVKWFSENDKDGAFPPAALRETYFLTRSQSNLARSVWSIDFSEFEFRPYSQGDVFAILSHHFRPSSGKRVYQLINALSQLYVAMVWEEGLPLIDTSQRLKAAMLADLDIPRGQVPFELQPTSSRAGTARRKQTAKGRA
jgi:hypothetical protein